MKEITPQNFKSKIFKPNITALIFFTGKWCYPCKRIQPILNELCEEFRGDMEFFQFMVDEETFKFAKRFNLNAVPTLIIFKKGVMVNSLVGYVTKPVLRNFLEETIGISKTKSS